MLSLMNPFIVHGPRHQPRHLIIFIGVQLHLTTHFTQHMPVHHKQRPRPQQHDFTVSLYSSSSGSGNRATPWGHSSISLRTCWLNQSVYHATMKPLRSLFLKLEINQISGADSFPSTLLPNFRLFFRRSGELYTNGFISVVYQPWTVDAWFGIASPFVGCSDPGFLLYRILTIG